MAGKRKKTPDWYRERMARIAEFRALLERRAQRDREIAAAEKREHGKPAEG